MPHRKAGFTLIELLIVVVIIGILAAIAIPKFHNTKEQSYIASMREDLRNLATAQEAYFNDNSMYAPNTAALGTNYLASPGVVVTVAGATGSSWRATATNPFTTVRCKLAAGTTKSYDGSVTCQ